MTTVELYKGAQKIMNKRKKIVATLGPAVEIRGGKKNRGRRIGWKNLIAEAQPKILLNWLKQEQHSLLSTSHTVITKNKVMRMATVKL